MRLKEWFGRAWFSQVHGRKLVYNTCWEDPRLDRVALALRPTDRIVMITSAGCNALDYALEGPARIHCVDINPRQNALLELKLAGIRRLQYETFFQMFGRGRVDRFHWLYEHCLRGDLSPSSRAYWDRHLDYFDGTGRGSSFYFRGAAGWFAHLVNVYIDRVAKVRPAIGELLEASSLEEQREIYDRRLREALWSRSIRWLVDRDATLALLGVPQAQRQQVERHYGGNMARFIEDCLEQVCSRLPIQDNYFWRVYVTGGYTPSCCPEYLRPENFEKLKAGLADCIEIHTSTLFDFLQRQKREMTRFVLLDHMDWMSTHRRPHLAQQWQAMVDTALPGARFLWRSGGLQVDFVDPIEVRIDGRARLLGDAFHYHSELASKLHEQDRVHTYGSFYIADLAA